MQTEIRNYFREITEDVEAACYGSYFLEFADYYARENDDGTQIIQLLYGALRAVLNQKLDRELIRYAFELRMMAAGGEYPQVFECAVCGAKHDLCAFLTDKNSVLCRSCVSKVQRSTPVLESTIYTMQYVISTPVERLFAFALSAQVKKEFIRLVEKFRRRYIDRDFKSLEILEIMRQTRNALYKDGQ